MSAIAKTMTADCCIAGGGPAGLMLGYLLARAGVRVVVVEKHADFLRDFRGDTIHPSTLQIMHRLGLLEALLALPHQRTVRLQAEIDGEEVTLADFSRLPVKCKFLAFMPQWDFLDFLARQAQQYPGFTLLRSCSVEDLLRSEGRVCGVSAIHQGQPVEIRAALVVGCDGRSSVVRQKAQLTGQSFGAPRDVVWFKLQKQPGDPAAGTGHRGPKQNFILIDRGSFWQCGYSIAKGTFTQMAADGIDAFRQEVANVSPFAPERLDELTAWQQLRLLDIRIDRLDSWAADGVLCIGDAAHAMSPIGGVGVNLAIQDAVATANLLTAPLLSGKVTLRQLNRVQRRRQFPTRLIQSVQIKMSGKKRQPGERSPLPRIIKRYRFLPFVFGWIIGLGVRRETPRVR